MFSLTIKKEELLSSLLTVMGAVDKKNSLPILSHVLLRLNDEQLFLTATDLELEIAAQVNAQSVESAGSITVPAKKFLDIIRSLDDGSIPEIVVRDKIVIIKHGRSSFRLSSLPAEDYPLSADDYNEVELSVPRIAFLSLLQSTHFAMSQQDVRIFLNGLLLEFEPNLITAVATDGHRMAVHRYACSSSAQVKLLCPKKGVQELIRLLNSISDEQILFTAGKAHFKLISSQFVFSSKLIEARFPPYLKAIPKENDKSIVVDCLLLKRTLSRIVILAHEKSKGVTLHVQSGLLTLIANNNEQEEAVESIVAETEGDELKIGLNASYLLDVLNHFSDGKVRLSMSQVESSILVESLADPDYQYIIMPMKI